MEIQLVFVVVAIVFGALMIRDSIITLAKAIEQGNRIKETDQESIVDKVKP